ncbi:cytochrome P450 [Schizophyllum fasciatum]
MEYILHSFLVLLTLLLASLAKYLIHTLSARSVLRCVSGPPSSSLIWGEEWDLFHTAPGSRYLTWHKRFGQVHQIISLTDARAISFIVSEKTYSFPKPHGVREWFRATIGKGIIWVEGKEAHEQQRRLIAPALSQQTVRNVMPVFYDISAKLCAQWAKAIDASSTTATEIEVTFWAGRFALDAVGRAAFDYDLDALSGGAHPLAEALDGLTNNENRTSSFYMRALFWIAPAVLRLGAKGRMIRRAKAELGAIAAAMWRDARAGGDAHGRNLIATMLKVAEASGSELKEEEVIDQMRTTISAGYETVSAIIAWILYEIAVHPDLQKKLRAEIEHAGEPSLDELNVKYRLLDATLKETLRMHPAILENHHEAAETISIPLSSPLPDTEDSQLVVPKGTLIAIPLNVLQTDPAIFGADADVFRAERWLERAEKGVRHKRELFIFSEGPRSCLGRAMAMAEIKAFVITVLKQYSLECHHDIEAFQSFVIRPRVRGQGASSLPLLVRKL